MTMMMMKMIKLSTSTVLSRILIMLLSMHGLQMMNRIPVIGNYHFNRQNDGLIAVSAFSVVVEHRPTRLRHRNTLSMGPEQLSLIEEFGNSYAYGLEHYYWMTQSLTGGTFSLGGDILAQTFLSSSSSSAENDDGDDVSRGKNHQGDISSSSPSSSSYDPIRSLQYFCKGLGGGIMWATWYGMADDVAGQTANLLHLSSSSTIDQLTSADGSMEALIVRVMLSVLLEQFLVAPFFYTFWDIPVPALLQGSSLRHDVPVQIRTKLGPLLVANAQVWTPVNIITYSLPTEYRLVFSSMADLVWQTVLSKITSSPASTESSTATTATPAVYASSLLSQSQNRQQQLQSPLAQLLPEPINQFAMELDRQRRQKYWLLLTLLVRFRLFTRNAISASSSLSPSSQSSLPLSFSPIVSSQTAATAAIQSPLIQSRSTSLSSRRYSNSSNNNSVDIDNDIDKTDFENKMTQQDHDDHDVDTANIRVLGVCGGIGSGKSTVCKVLVSEFGCIGHIEADRLAHEVYRPNSPVLKELADAFGDHLIQEDGQLNRPALGKVVFGNAEKMQQLERIVWPHVSALVQAQIQELKDSFVPSADSTAGNKRPIIIVEAAVLLDAGWNKFSDGVWVVNVPPEVALERLQEQRGMAHDEALQRVKAQESRRGMKNLQNEIETGVVTSVVENRGDLEALKTTLREKLTDETVWYTTSEVDN